MPSRIKVRYVKFTPEEMAMDVPDDVSDRKRFPMIARGRAEWEQFLSIKRGYVRLDSDLRAYFKSDAQVNNVLRHAIMIAEASVSTKRKRSA